MLAATILAASLGQSPVATGADYWRPSGHLSQIKLIASCGETQGGVAVARMPDKIYYCPYRISYINDLSPGAAHFFFVHEYGHLALSTGDERKADCWAANEFKTLYNGIVYIDSIIHFLNRYMSADMAHGQPDERAAHIRDCFINEHALSSEKAIE